MIARVILRQELGRLLRIANNGVEVDDAVVLLARTNPLVERLALGLAFRRPVGGALERRQRSAVDPQAPGARPGDQLAVGGDQILSAW
jgi:hypothetical protein